jgi:hypothetical protein
MSAKNTKAVALAAAKPAPTPSPADVDAGGAATAEAAEPFYQRHPKIANAIFAALCIYVAMIWLLALDQTFHWGIFGPKISPLP